MAILRPLYKYLPSRFADGFVRHGQVLFRSLSYFRALEHAARGDEAEGVHIDAPDNDVTLESESGTRVVDRLRFLRSIEQSRVFAFCCSTRFGQDLFDEFNADACVVIHDPAKFFGRCAIVARRPLPIDPCGLLHREVTYFQPNRAAPLDITDAHNIPFLKHAAFAEQTEYRAVFARRGGFAMTQRIVSPAFTFAKEVAAAPQRERLLRVGDLRGIAEVVTMGGKHSAS